MFACLLVDLFVCLFFTVAFKLLSWEVDKVQAEAHKSVETCNSHWFLCRKRANVQFDKYQIWKTYRNESTNQRVGNCEDLARGYQIWYLAKQMNILKNAKSVRYMFQSTYEFLVKTNTKARTISNCVP